MKNVLSVLLIAVLMVACTPVEKVAYRTVVGSKAFLDSIKAAHPDCAAQENPSVLCADLRRATAAKDSLIDAGKVYCNVAVFDANDETPCKPTAKGTPAGDAAAAALSNALAQYQQTEKDLKGVIH